MPAFDYIAYNRRGKRTSGVISADSDRHARRLLRSQDLLPSNVSEMEQSTDKGTLPGYSSWGRRRISVFDLSLLLQQLAILLQSGLPLVEALRMTIEQAETRQQKRIVESWCAQIMEGRSLSEALRRSQYQVPESVLAGLGVGEESGHLPEVMQRLAEELEHASENSRTLKRALIYPATLLATSVFTVGIMMVYVVPKIAVIFATSKREMPLITRVVMTLSEFTRHHGLWLALLVLAMVAGGNLLLREAGIKQRWHRLLLQTPGLGPWLRMAALADWSRSLGTLLHNGVPALSALKIAAAVVNNLELRARLNNVTERMRKGSSLQKALHESGAGSGFVIHMVGSGEASSELDTMLLRVADYYRLRLESGVEVFLKIINPVLIILMGLVILSVMAAVMLPIMDMNNMI
jgi:general secretion pathway protein F